jgi:hypothetical protein
MASLANTGPWYEPARLGRYLNFGVCVGFILIGMSIVNSRICFLFWTLRQKKTRLHRLLSQSVSLFFEEDDHVNGHSRILNWSYQAYIRPIIIRPKFQGISIDHEFPNSFPVDICGSNGSCLGCCVVNQQRGFTGAEATEVTEPGAEKKDRPQRETPGDVNVGSD